MALLEKTHLGDTENAAWIEHLLGEVETFAFSTGDVLVLRNTGSTAVTITLSGTSTLLEVDGAVDLPTYDGITLSSIPAAAARVIPLDTVRAYLGGLIRIAGGAGCRATVLSKDTITIPKPQLLVDYRGDVYGAASDPVRQAEPTTFTAIHPLARAGEGYLLDEIGVLRRYPADEPRWPLNRASRRRQGLMLEAAVTNMVVRNREFVNPWNAGSGIVRAAGAARGVDGINNSASTMTEDLTTVSRAIGQAITFVAGTQYTFSCFVKRQAGTRHVGMYFDAGSIWGTIPVMMVNLDTGAITSSGGVARIVWAENIGGGWWFISLSAACQSSGASGAVVAMNSSATNVFNPYTGDGVSAMAFDFIQCEVGHRATTPIVTGATTAARAAEYAPIDLATPPKWWNPSGGTYYVHVEGIPVDIQSRVLGGVSPLGFVDGVLFASKNVSNAVNLGGSSVLIELLPAGQYTGQPLKFAMKWTCSANGLAGHVAACLNGRQVLRDTATTLLSNQTRMGFGFAPWVGIADGCNGTIVEGAYWASHLTDAEMLALTS